MIARYLLFAAFCFLLPLEPVQSQEGRSVLEYYRLLPANETYPLFQKEGKWMTRSIVGYDFEVTLEVQDGFVQFWDEGTGGGSVLIEVALFRTSSGDDLIAYHEGGFDGSRHNSKLRFFTFEGDEPKEVTSKVFPSLETVRKSLLTGTWKALSEEEQVTYVSPVFALNQAGTTIDVRIDWVHLKALCSGAIEEPETPAEIKALCERTEELRQLIVEFAWDKEKANFKVSGRRLEE